jgi:hypothetical protein
VKKKKVVPLRDLYKQSRCVLALGWYRVVKKVSNAPFLSLFFNWLNQNVKQTNSIRRRQRYGSGIYRSKDDRSVVPSKYQDHILLEDKIYEDVQLCHRQLCSI